HRADVGQDPADPATGVGDDAVGAGLAELGEAANLGEAERPAVSRLDERGQEPAERVGQAAAPAAHAPRPVVDDLDVGQLAGQAARPAVQLSIEDESGPEALGDLDVQETADALAGTEGRLAE